MYETNRANINVNRSTLMMSKTNMSKAQQKTEILFENIHLYRFPHCSMDPAHSSYQLNNMCLEPNCKENFIPLCANCLYESHKQKKGHLSKPLKMIFNELADQIQKLYDEFETYKVNKDPIEQALDDMIAELKNLEELARQMQDSIQFYLQKYSKVMRKEPFERIAVRRILKEIFKSDTEEVLRDKLLELGQYVKIEEDTLKVNDAASVAAWEDQKKHAGLYIDDIKQPLERMVDIRIHLEKTLKQYAMAEEDLDLSDGEKSEAGFEPTNIAELSRTRFEQTMKKNVIKKDESEKKKESLKKLMEEHIEECENKHCSFVDIPYKIKWWKTLWFKANTDCPDGKKLNLEMEMILNDIRKTERKKLKH